MSHPDERRAAFQEQQARNDLRDQFAMAALTGEVANPDSRGGYSEFAARAYRLADAMLEARK
jgi:hypothetical protein